MAMKMKRLSSEEIKYEQNETENSENKDNKWFESVCRGCLNIVDLKNMRETIITDFDAIEAYEYITKEQLDLKIPAKMCTSCISQLLLTHNFLKMLEHSSKIFREALNKMRNLDFNDEEHESLKVIQLTEENNIKYNDFYEESNVSQDNCVEYDLSSDDEKPLLEKFNVKVEEAKENLRRSTDPKAKGLSKYGCDSSISDKSILLNGVCLICSKEVINETKHLRELHQLDWITSTCLNCSFCNENKLKLIEHSLECIKYKYRSEEDTASADTKMKKVKMKNTTKRKNMRTSEFKCNQCGDVGCNSYEGIYQHFKEWHSSESNCILCDEKCSHSLNLTYHIMVHHGKLKCCKLCLVSFNTTNELLKHYKSEEHNTKCTICNQQFKNRKAVYEHRRKKHIKSHLEDIKFKCPQCPKEFANRNNIRRHILAYHHDFRFLCDTCGQSYTTNRNLQLHIMKCHKGQEVEMKDNKKNFFCEACGRELKIFHKYAIARHKAKHKNHTHVCRKCYESFASEEELNTHVQEQSHELFKCTVCPTKFVREENLKIHLKNHVSPGWNKNYFKKRGKSANLRNEKGEYACIYCPKAFKLKQRLDIHLRVHTNERPYKCHICQKGFKTWIHRKTHVNVHLGIKKWQCRYCQKAFTYSSTLKAHEMTHTGERPYRCPECKKGFTYSSGLKKHRQTHFRTGTANYEKKVPKTLKKDIDKKIDSEHEDNTEFLYKYSQIFVGSDGSYESFTEPSKDQLQ